MADADPRRDGLRSILDAAVAAADPYPTVAGALTLEDGHLRAAGADPLPAARIWLVGAGKAAPRMAQAAVGALGGGIAGGMIATKTGHSLPVSGIDVWEAGHPVPDAHGLAAAGEAMRVARAAGEGDLVLCLLSGGASALWPAPPDGVSLGDLQRVTRALLQAGAPISELNAVRRHLSRLAGGQLARIAAPARVVTLAISDVVGAGPDVIGSGPTLADPTTFADALEVLRSREIAPPAAVLRHLQAGAAGDHPETPKPGELPNVAGFHLLADVGSALEGARRRAEELGYAVEIRSSTLEGEAREVAGEIVAAARASRDGRPRLLLWGGETTVTVRGDGLGGRNQELALAAALLLEGEEGVVVASLGTDGTDGPTDAAGGIADGGTAARARTAGADPDRALARNDAYHCLRAAGDLLLTGPTGTNVNDVVAAVVS